MCVNCPSTRPSFLHVYYGEEKRVVRDAARSHDLTLCDLIYYYIFQARLNGSVWDLNKPQALESQAQPKAQIAQSPSQARTSQWLMPRCARSL